MAHAGRQGEPDGGLESTWASTWVESGNAERPACAESGDACRSGAPDARRDWACVACGRRGAHIAPAGGVRAGRIRQLCLAMSRRCRPARAYVLATALALTLPRCPPRGPLTMSRHPPREGVAGTYVLAAAPACALAMGRAPCRHRRWPMP